MFMIGFTPIVEDFVCVKVSSFEYVQGDEVYATIYARKTCPPWPWPVYKRPSDYGGTGTTRFHDGDSTKVKCHAVLPHV